MSEVLDDAGVKQLVAGWAAAAASQARAHVWAEADRVRGELGLPSMLDAEFTKVTVAAGEAFEALLARADAVTASLGLAFQGMSRPSVLNRLSSAGAYA